MLATVRGETDGHGSRVETVLPEREEMGMEGARGARRRALHQGTAAEDRAGVHHAADQGFCLRPFSLRFLAVGQDRCPSTDAGPVARSDARRRSRSASALPGSAVQISMTGPGAPGSG
ncbi:hypothetical protein STENM36S_03377 [Streptomyces tendae]